MTCWVDIDSCHESVFCDAKMASERAIYFGRAYIELKKKKLNLEVLIGRETVHK